VSNAPNKTQITATDPADFIAAVEHPTRRADAEALDQLFRKVTGFLPAAHVGADHHRLRAISLPL